MGFKKTSEGRVFFKSPDNDDTPTTSAEKKVSAPPKKTSPILPKDQVQMQILMLLKSLNTKLKSSKDDRATIKKELVEYKATIKTLEKKTSEHETNYIDLEQKISLKQNEVGKKATRIEDSVKTTLQQLEDAKNLVKALEEKTDGYDESLEGLKEEVEKQRKTETALTRRQTTLEKTQKDQGEKMVDGVAAYVALTKRVSESEARAETLDNKIEENASEYLKLDRKIDRIIEDRSRILRKVERIEQAVLETRDALNAKAMVLLTDQGVAGVDMPQLTDDNLHADPVALNKRLNEEAMMPWWRQPIRIQRTSFVLLLMVVLLIGWIMSASRNPVITAPTPDLNRAPPPTVSLSNIEPTLEPQTPSYETQNSEAQPIEDFAETNKRFSDVEYEIIEPYEPEVPLYQEDIAKSAETQQMDTDFGITIHNGISNPGDIKKNSQESIKTAETAPDLDINNQDQMIKTFDRDPEAVAQRLNMIEPGHTEHTTTAMPKAVTTTISKSSDYQRQLRKKISPDPQLTDITRQIENQAFEGVPEAQHDMGAIYVSGHGKIKKDLRRAVLWFTEAANNGVANAKYNLGVLYHQGLGVESNIDKAMELYASAAQIGHPEAQYNLGIANIEGIGVPYNPGRASRYFESAAEDGVTEAAYNLGLIHENGLLGAVRPDLALSWYKRAADAGSVEASAALKQLANSLGIDVRDVERAITSSKPDTNNDTALLSKVQQELMRRGLYPGPVDGVLGPMTRQAIERFEASANLKITGMPSQSLLDYLNKSAH